MLKDLTLAIEAAESVKCKVELGETSKKIYQQITDKGMGRKDFGIIYDLILKNKAWMAGDLNLFIFIIWILQQNIKYNKVWKRLCFSLNILRMLIFWWH